MSATGRPGSGADAARPGAGDGRASAVLVAGAAVIGAALAGMVAVGDLAARPRIFLALFGLAALAHAAAVVAAIRAGPPGRRGVVTGIVAAAVALRLLLLAVPPSLSADAYRYLWDGRLTLAGVSPYARPPAAPELAPFRDDVVYPRLSHPGWRTIYPPGAQLLFAGAQWLVPDAIRGWKAMAVAFDLLALALLLRALRALGRPPAWVVVYAWHPLVLVEVAGSGHLEGPVLAATAAALLAAARGRPALAGGLAGAGTLLKLYPALLLPAVLPPWGPGGRRALATAGLAAGVVAAGYALFAGDGLAALGSLPRFLAEEDLGGPVRALVEPVLAPLGRGSRQAARLGCLVALAAVAALTAARALRGSGGPPAERARRLAGAFCLFAPSLFPWYATWLVPTLTLAPSWPWLSLSYTAVLAYLIQAQPVWHLPGWVPLAQVLPVGLGLALARAGRRPRAPATGGSPGPAPGAPPPPPAL